MRLFYVILAVALTGCATLRDARLDDRLPSAELRTVDLGRYKSVQGRKGGQNSDLAIAAAISGGGHRAANFAAGVFMALEQLVSGDSTHDVLREVDYFSTVSGGGFAAGTYIASLYDHGQLADAGGYSFTDAIQKDRGGIARNLRRDYQSTVLESLLCLRCIGHLDGGDMLERKIDRLVLGSKNRRGRYSLRLGDLFKAADSTEEVRFPYWVSNATIFENGMRFPVAPDILEHYKIVRCTHNMKTFSLEGSAFNLPLAVGAKASASFPVAFPATTLVSENHDDRLNQYLHLLDGGLADNIGYRTAIDLLRQDSAKHKVLLIIDAYKGASHPHSSRERSPSGVGMAYRITKIGLDAEHALLERDISRLVGIAEGEGEIPIHVITFSFAALKPVIGQEIADIKDELSKLRKRRSDARLRRLQREIDLLLERSKSDLRGAENAYAMYDDVRAVETSLNITAGEQQLLFRAGAVAVEQRLDLIKEHIVSIIKMSGE